MIFDSLVGGIAGFAEVAGVVEGFDMTNDIEMFVVQEEMKDSGSWFGLEEKFSESVPYFDLVQRSKDLLHLLYLGEATGLVREASFLQQILCHSFLKSSSVTISLLNGFELCMLINCSFGCNYGSCATTVILILDGDKDSAMTRVVLLLLFDASISFAFVSMT